MNINWDLLLKIVMPIATLFLGAWLKNLFESKEKLIAHYGHVSSFKLKTDSPETNGSWVYTHSVIIKNTGRKTATNVRLGHTNLPLNLIVQPDIEYSIKDLPGGGKELLIPSLTPKKEITVSYLYFPPLTYNQINSHIESDFGPAKIVNVLLQPVISKWLSRLVLALVSLGVISAIYLVILFIIWLYNLM